MKLLFKQGEEIFHSLDLSNVIYSDIIYGTDKVKEISLVHYINNSDEITLNSIYEDIKFLKYKNIDSIIVYYDKEHYFNFRFPIKDIFYRTFDYMQKQKILFQENLSIRFEEDNEIFIDTLNGHMLCDTKHCKYYDNSFCKKYS